MLPFTIAGNPRRDRPVRAKLDRRDSEMSNIPEILPGAVIEPRACATGTGSNYTSHRDF